MSSESGFSGKDQQESMSTEKEISEELEGQSSFDMVAEEADMADTSQVDDTAPLAEEEATSDSTFGIDLGENTAEDISKELEAIPESGRVDESSLLATEVNPEDEGFDPFEDSSSLDQMSRVLDGEDTDTEALEQDDLDDDSSMEVHAESQDIDLDSNVDFDATESDELNASQAHDDGLDAGFEKAMQEPTRLEQQLSYASGAEVQFGAGQTAVETMEDRTYQGSGKQSKVVAAVVGISVGLGLFGVGYNMHSTIKDLRSENAKYASLNKGYETEIARIQNINSAAKEYLDMKSSLADFRKKYDTIMISSQAMEKELESYRKSSVNYSALNEQVNKQAEQLKKNAELINELEMKSKRLEGKVKQYEAQKGSLDTKGQQEYAALKKEYDNAKKRIVELEKEMEAGESGKDSILRQSLEQVRQQNVELGKKAEVAQKYTTGLEAHLGYVHNKLGIPGFDKDVLLSGVDEKTKKQYEDVFGKLERKGTGPGDDNMAYKKKFKAMQQEYAKVDALLKEKSRYYDAAIAKLNKSKKTLSQTNEKVAQLESKVKSFEASAHNSGSAQQDISGYGGFLEREMLKDKKRISRYVKVLKNLASQKYGKLSKQEEADAVKQERYMVLRSILDEAEFTDTKKRMVMWNLADEYQRADSRSYNKAFTFVAQYLNSEIMEFGRRYNPRKNVSKKLVSYPRAYRKKMEKYLEATKMFTYALGGMAEDPHFRDHFRASVTTLRQMGENALVDKVLEKYNIEVRE